MLIEKQQSSNQYGMSQELLFLSLLVNYGTVSIPYGNSGRYDCILDINGIYYRIQIKSLNKINEDTISIPFANSRLSANGSVKKVYTPDEVDYIGIVYENELYLFPTTMAQKSLTVRTHRENIKYNSHYIGDFHIENILNIKIKSWVDLREKTRKENTDTSNIKEYYCISCGKPVSRENSKCLSCARLTSVYKVERPSREELKEKIRIMTFVDIGKEYGGVTDNTVKKWCKAYNLPYLKSDIEQYTDEQWEEV